VRCCSFAPRGRCGRDTARLRRWWLACTATSLPSSKVGCTSHVDGVQPSSQCVTHSLSSPPTGVAGRVFATVAGAWSSRITEKNMPRRARRHTCAFEPAREGDLGVLVEENGRREAPALFVRASQRSAQPSIANSADGVRGTTNIPFRARLSRRHSPGRACMDAPRTS